MPLAVTLPPDEELHADGAKTAGWWHESERPGRLVCDLCPRGCALKPGERGFCFVRENRDGRMVLSTYGRSTGFCIDPIEKKPLNQFYPGTAVLSFGTAGCNLGCRFCQNWSQSRSREIDRVCEVAAPEDIAAAALDAKCRSVAFTYNDPIVFAEYAIDTARACRQRGVKTVAVTNGYISTAARGPFFESMDAANVDLKGFSEDFYRRLTLSHLAPVLDTLRWLHEETDVWLEITNLLIPGENDSLDELGRMCDWLAGNVGPDVPLHFTAFHPDYQLADRPATSIETLIAAHDLARKAGLNYVYTGNVDDPAHQSTFCPSCGKVVIERRGYELGAYQLSGSRCAHCGAAVAGRFDAVPGDWGSRRMPIQIQPRVREAKRRKKAPPAAEPCDWAHLDTHQEQTLLRAAGRAVSAAVHGQRLELSAADLPGLADRPIIGAFVTLKRSGQLRSCCGFLGPPVALAEGLSHAAARAATDDPRFPPISPGELKHLDVDVWLLFGLEAITARGKDRIDEVVIGTHGLQVTRGTARGLLLPSVAVDYQMDAERFLQQTCLKAGLPAGAWLDDDTSVMRFQGHSIHGRIELAANGVAEEPVAKGAAAAFAEFCRGAIEAILAGRSPGRRVSGETDELVCGVVLAVGVPGRAEKLVSSKLALRPDVALGATLSALAELTAKALKGQGVGTDRFVSAAVDLMILDDPAMHGTVAAPDLAGFDPQDRAVVVVDGPKSVWLYDAEQSPQAVVDEAAAAVAVTDPATAAVVSLAARSTARRMVVIRAPAAEKGTASRHAAVAGTFYPAHPGELGRMLDAFLPGPPQPEPWRGILVPHAGLVYSGRVAGAVYQRVQFPETAIILCPRHTGLGAEWAVAPHEAWETPGARIASDPELARRLAAAIPGLELDARAHAEEHAIEVQLPFFARLAPKTRVVGIAVGRASLERCREFAAGLAEVIRQLPAPPLLVISSDMNHFATDEENRRLDALALAALERLDPEDIYRTIHEQHISMCGVLPAVIVLETLRLLGALSRCQRVAYATSADTSGDDRRVVGYAGMLFA